MMSRLRHAKVNRVSGAAVGALTLLLFCATTLFAAEPKFPQLTGRVVDDAGVLSAATKNQLTDMLAEHEHSTGEQVVVVTLPSLQGYPIEDFGYQLGRHWGIGQKGTNTGALVIIAPNEHKVRIEVGYGLEGKLTDAASRVIIDRDMLPAFRRGDFNAGVLAGAASTIAVLGGDASASASGASSSAPQSTQGQFPWGIIIFLAFFLIILMLRRCVGRHGPFVYTGGGWGGDGSSGGFWAAGDLLAAVALRGVGENAKPFHARGASAHPRCDRVDQARNGGGYRRCCNSG